MRKLFLAAVMGASVLAGVPAIAQTAAPPPPPTAPGGPRGAGPADANRDGIVTRAEATAEAERRFTAIDANRDGKVTKDELRAERERHRAMRADRRFDRIDKNRDGSVTKAEMTAAGERRMANRAERGPRAGMHHGPKHGGMSMGKRVDPNGDGEATRAEWLARADARFAREDANKDGRIDANERTAMRDLRKMHRAGNTPPPPPPAG
ncbi:hypothetical protein M0208_02395 [Sphingomonas sp. SUN019]|uniref:EF-hand domain-containing protein n=1 Tax=Sphingomonas sp. SUN019 TaxID=2937788 RepID=UPI002164427A|nr:hypothetical protein [Sphingomonas sp. SUN019]UVO49416.1 hypothetical protein M0208_02395 [Sphingomonas sp. SUN019]